MAAKKLTVKAKQSKANQSKAKQCLPLLVNLKQKHPKAANSP